MSGTILVDDEVRKAKTDAVLTETIDDERTIRQAERFFTDSNMILNLPDFVSFIFTTKTLPAASLISPIRVKKHALEICAVSPTIAATAATVNITLDFSEEETAPKPASTPDITATQSDLFFDTDEKDTTTPNTNIEENPSLLDF